MCVKTIHYEPGYGDQGPGHGEAALGVGASELLETAQALLAVGPEEAVEPDHERAAARSQPRQRRMRPRGLLGNGRGRGRAHLPRLHETGDSEAHRPPGANRDVVGVHDRDAIGRLLRVRRGGEPEREHRREQRYS